jgi:AmmeMemoRadiSam system protein B
VAGKFYPGRPEELKSSVEKYLAAAKPVSIPGKLLGVVSPHAGYVYSGPAAGWAFRQLQGGKFDAVVVMAPSHRYRHDTAGVMDLAAYRTPLGEEKIAREYVSALLKSQFFSAAEGLFSSEHSLEVQIPFIQIALPGVPIVPVILPTHDKTLLDGAAAELFRAFKDKNAVFVASSDMSHYQPYDENNRIDDRTLKIMEKMDPAALLEAGKSGGAELCGLAPVYVLWKLAELQGGGTMTLLKHENSGDTAGDKSAVVGYGAVAVSIKGGK